MKEIETTTITSDVRKDVQLFGVVELKHFLTIIPSMIIGVLVFGFLPGPILPRFLIFLLFFVGGVYIALTDMVYKHKVKKRRKKIIEDLDVENISEISAYDSPFMVFKDKTVGICIRAEAPPWESSSDNSKKFDLVITKTLLRQCSLNNFELTVFAENREDNSTLDTRYKELFNKGDPLYLLGEARNKCHEKIKKEHGRKTYYTVRLRQIEAKRSIKESIKDTRDMAYGVISELSKIGLMGFVISTNEIEKSVRKNLLPEGRIYKPVFMDQSFFERIIGAIDIIGRFIKLRKNKTEEKNEYTKDEIDLEDINPEDIQNL
ncbi:hypothetical protein [Maledivibacter halophilus]|uniref:PrgI family protein n=1 Tax=Maledivibacter halophilus TaxID=36842 RepID=A0A1T5MG58_9FIRM|nr:hypothetical protein [Maledivibacter halophilus]SKC86888.1 hypothetical protein SAMN02194393_04590 [Maledivibacter halophilus]